jgi:hypothetical protein
MYTSLQALAAGVLLFVLFLSLSFLLSLLSLTITSNVLRNEYVRSSMPTIELLGKNGEEKENMSRL